jgi:predicted kinase
MLVIMAGLPGTGKSTLATELARLHSGVVLSKDEIRAVLFRPSEIEYSATQDDFVMGIMLKTAGYLLRKEPTRLAILDGRTFSQQYQVERVRNFAAMIHQPVHILECVCSEDSARARLERQQADGTHPAANRDFALYLAVKARFQPIPPPKTLIDTDQPLETCLSLASEALR